MSRRNLKTAKLIVAFLISSTLDVRVRAETTTTSIRNLPLQFKVTQVPDNCLLESEICAISTKQGRAYDLVMESAVVRLDENTHVVRTTAGKFSLMQGRVRVKTEGLLEIQVPGGKIQATSSEFVLRRIEKKYFVDTISGSVFLMPLGSRESVEVLEGLTNWLGPVGPSGHALTGIPTPTNPKLLLSLWSRLYAGNKKHFKEDVFAYQSRWASAVRLAGDTAFTMASRTIANAEAERARRRKQARIEAIEKARLREFFKSRTFE